MKLKEELVVTNVGGEYVAVPVGEAAERLHGVVRLNESAGFILDCLQNETTEEAIIDAMLARYEADRAAIAAGVAKTLERLRELDALDE